MSELIEKSQEGEYTLTHGGNMLVYRKSMQKLFRYYMIKALHKSNEETAQVLQKVTPYLKENFHSLQDYLGKISDIAKFTGASDPQPFETFMSRHFISTIEKEKSALLEKELSQVELSYENEKWMPSQKLLKLYASSFQGKESLNFTRQIPVLSSTGQPIAGASSTTAEPPPQDSQPEEAKESSQAQAPSEETPLPGKVILQSYREQFQKLEPVDFNKLKRSPATSETKPQQEEQKQAKAQPSSPEAPRPLPGKVCLEQFGSLFQGATPLPRFKTSTSSAQEPTPAVKQFIKLKNVAAILNKIKHFTKNQDNEGYKNWYMTLTPQVKAALKINALITKELTHPNIPWEENLKEVARTFQLSGEYVQNLARELKNHRATLQKIQQALSEARVKFNMSASEPAALYGQLIAALDDATDAEQYQVSLEFILKALSSQEARDYLFEKLSKLSS